MEVIVERCAGIDIGKRDVKACIRVLEASRWRVEVRTFTTMTRDLLQLRDWLASEAITTVGMEATGAYWKPVNYLLEESFAVQLLNARHLHNVPGRKTDVMDAEWICQMVQFGLVRPSFVPPAPIRQLRDLTRYRTEVVRERVRDIAEIGVNMTAFPTAGHLASWAAVCPGNNESAGKQLSGKTRNGNAALRAALGEAALSITRTKNSYLAARYRRVAARRGKKRAIVAVQHSMLISIWHMLTHEVAYHDLGPEYFTERTGKTRQTRRLIAQLGSLGYTVRLEPLAAA